jgi:hypothetical protein
VLKYRQGGKKWLGQKEKGLVKANSQKEKEE